METRANYVLLGVFTIAMSLAVIVFSLWMSKAQFVGADTFEVVFQGPVTGLAKGGDVRFNGIKVGDVRSLRIDEKNPQHVVARITVQSETPIRTSSVARLEGVGFTGVSLIQLTAGDPSDPLLKPKPGGAAPRIIAERGALDDLLATGSSMAVEANEVLSKLNAILSDENVDRLSDTIKQIHAASVALAASDGAINQVSRAASSIAALSDDAHQTLDRFSARADTTFDIVDRAAKDVGDSADLASTQALPNISAAARDLRRLSASLEQLSGELTRGEASLLPGGAPAKPVIRVQP